MWIDLEDKGGSSSFTFFLAALPLLLVNLLLLSMEAALRRGDLPLFPPSGFNIHHELFPVPSFWTRTKRLCSDRLCLMEFCRWKKKRKAGWGAGKLRDLCLLFYQKHLKSALTYKLNPVPTGGSLSKTCSAWHLTYRGERRDFKVTQQYNSMCYSHKHVHAHTMGVNMFTPWAIHPEQCED